MEGEPVPPCMSLAMIVKGKEQVVPIDNKRILNMVMAILGAKEMPVFTVTQCDPEMVKVSIKLDVSCARYHVGGTISTAEVEGEPHHSQILAEKSAVLRAIKHLNDRHLIEVLDFSSKVADSIDEDNAFGFLHSAVHFLKKVAEHWEVVLSNSKGLAIQLSGRDATTNVFHQNDKWDMYGSMKEFMASTIETFAPRVIHANTKISELEFERKKYHSINIERYQEHLRKGYMQTVELTAKMILDCVLQYIGAGPTEYQNEPTSSGLTKGAVNFKIPKIEGIRFSGNIQIKGKSTYSEDAEEEAAFNALLYMEQKYKIRVVDLNISDRLTAENENKQLLNILEQMLTVGHDTKNYWSEMNETMKTKLEDYQVEAETRFHGEGAAKKIEAYNFCAKELNELAYDSAQRFGNCADMFEELKQIHSKLDEMKTEIGLE